MSEDQDLRQALGRLADRATLPAAAEEKTIVRAKKRRRFVGGTISVLSVVALFAGAAGAYSIIETSPPSTRPQQSAQTSPGSSIAGDCKRGPWSQHCAEADWARSVVVNAGFRLMGDTGSALKATDGQVIFHFWAFTPDEQPARLDQALAKENYRQLPERVEGVTIYTDGIRFAWSTQGLWVWLTSAGIENGSPGGTAPEVRRAVLDDLVTASAGTTFD